MFRGLRREPAQAQENSRYLRVAQDSRVSAQNAAPGEGESNLEPEVRKPGTFYYMLKPFVSEDLKIILAHLSKESLPL